MDLLRLIKERKTVRQYQDKPIPRKVLDKIIEAGRWGSSLHGFQPWKFLVIKNKGLIIKIAEIMNKEARSMRIGGKIVLFSSSKTISSAAVLIVSYNTASFTKWAIKLRKEYKSISSLAELSAISAAIQNMILVADSLGLGSCWLDAPLFCEKKINKLLGVNENMSAMLALGYPVHKSKRSTRKSISDTIKYIE